ncbi:unnamed protein product [Rotaria magnacalcarata]|uniref:Uncharacterized protein n=1 Tax=Rotaria magnacalcarata TaxID=392030 RepID=A0A816LRD6_9BILA|nr:unnamed protein product [Rotaria magnacalcarata]CAF1950862.1 unnamed protein product [Rotaria magnacalcarata]CAF2157078.1 unnamed protein product [Rotaria magnacalcarata]
MLLTIFVLLSSAVIAQLVPAIKPVELAAEVANQNVQQSTNTGKMSQMFLRKNNVTPKSLSTGFFNNNTTIIIPNTDNLSSEYATLLLIPLSSCACIGCIASVFRLRYET